VNLPWAGTARLEQHCRLSGFANPNTHLLIFIIG